MEAKNLFKNYSGKNMRFSLMIIAVALLSFSFGKIAGKLESEPAIRSKAVTQVAIVVKDIEKARQAWAKVLNVPAPEVSIAESHSSRPTQFNGKPTDAKSKLAFIKMDNLQIEIIQPLGGKSTWQEYLDTHGEGIHYIAFAVKDINGVEKKFEKMGMPTVQSGGWNGGAYSYIDATRDLSCIIELLENY